MLLGAHEHTIDDKNRLTLPARFRQAFADGVVVTRGLDGCLYAFRRPDWDRLVESRLAALDPLSPEGRRLERFFYSGASETELDKQGRVMLPRELIEHAKLGREVVVAGVNDRLEIWDRATWRKELAEVEGSAEDVAERLAAKRD
ncbi:MAG: division/cell wall cluster transcriptional repressor MraZ [Gaiellaceae bacterium]|jgi:MraZ protein|nr:MAG: division/cell wall cluster transcriptional repressor MraZ [Actinomycetota bacterium]